MTAPFKIRIFKTGKLEIGELNPSMRSDMTSRREAKASKTERQFSSFDANEALKELQVEVLYRWEIDFRSFQPSSFFPERLRRLENFDLTFSERAKELRIDAFCEEGIEKHQRLKIWKAASLKSDDLAGTVDYLIAARKAYLADPLLCIAEAKKDDFEKGLAQCLVAMKACRWNNAQAGKEIDVFGIVTNGEGWKFYKLTIDGQVFETLLYSIVNQDSILGILEYVFARCEENLNSQTNHA